MLTVILETWSEGGIVLVPIFLAAFWGFVLVMRTWIRMGRGRGEAGVMARFEEIVRRVEAGDEEGARAVLRQLPRLSAFGAALLLDNRSLPEQSLRSLLEERLAHRLFETERHIPLISSLAAAAPLLGLLGTVSGLIHTFRAMQEFGTGNSQLLSRGISEALIAAQTGLLVAIILILLGHRLEGRIQWLKDQTEYGITLLLNSIVLRRDGSAPRAQAGAGTLHAPKPEGHRP